MDSARGMAWACCSSDIGMRCGYPDKLSHLERAPTCFVTVSSAAASRKPQVEPALSWMSQPAQPPPSSLTTVETPKVVSFSSSSIRNCLIASLSNLLAISFHETIAYTALLCIPLSSSIRARSARCYPAGPRKTACCRHPGRQHVSMSLHSFTGDAKIPCLKR